MFASRRKMSYITLFRKYVNPSNRWEDQFVNQSEKRLRWLKDEAFGNSKFPSTAFNVRHAHICNRNIERNLGVDLQYIANKHAKKCQDLEDKQRELWRKTQSGSAAGRGTRFL